MDSDQKMLNSQIPSAHNKYYLLVLVGMIAVIGSALAFEHIGGYIPCKLCLEQRQPWYLGIPIMIIACLAVYLKWSPKVVRGLMLIAGLIMAYSLYLGIHHSGVEWAFWEGPGDCGVVSGGLAENTDDLFKQLQETVGPSCTEASLRVFGLSFAGWNALMSLALAVIALRTAFAK